MNAYFKDMQVVDERLTTLENEVEELHKLLTDIRQILEAINGKQEETEQGCKGKGKV